MIDRAIALAAAGFVIAGQHGDAFQQRGFASAVLADDDGDGLVETQFELLAQKRQAERIGRGISDALRVKPEPPQVRRRQVDRAISSGHASSPGQGNFRFPNLGTSPQNTTRTLIGPDSPSRFRWIEPATDPIEFA